MPVYVNMEDRDTKEVVLLRVRGTYDVETLNSDGENVNKYFNRIYADQLGTSEKANAIDVQYVWSFFKQYDFGGEVKSCVICHTDVLHKDNGCIRCEARTYQLHIWVKPNQSHYYPNTFSSIDGDGSDFKYQKSKFAFNPLIAECDTPASLLGLIDASQNKKLTHSVHAMTTCKVMDDPMVRGMITDHDLSDLGIYEVRWYYVTGKDGLLNNIKTTYPPHWY